MWFFLWVIFVLGMAGFFLWSYHTTYEQKRAWKTFAQKFNLQYISNKLMEPPTMTGDIKGCKVNFYPQVVEDNLGKRTTQTVVEVFLNKIPETVCVVGSSNFGDFVNILDLPDPFNVDHGQWPKSALARGFEEDYPQNWFLNNPKRVEAIAEVFKLPFASAFFTDGEQAFVAIRTPNPLSDPKRINQVVKKLFSVVEMLESETVQQTVPEEETEEKKR